MRTRTVAHCYETDFVVALNELYGFTTEAKSEMPLSSQASVH